jgi:hypothetical protein
MPPSPFLPANLQLFIKSARHRGDDLSVAGQPPDLLSFLYQGFVRQRAEKFAIFLCIKFL